MNVLELLGHELFNLPAQWVGFRYTDSIGRERICRNYHDFIVHQLGQYQQLLAELDDILVDDSPGLVIRTPFVSNALEVKRAVHVLCIGIIHALKHYADGSPSRAYEHLAAALGATSLLVDNQPVALLHPPAHYFETRLDEGNQAFYRLRRSDEPITDPRELFHLPFDKRWKTRGYRFSIAGYPSLYAATTPWLALRELQLTAWPADMYAVRLRAIPPTAPDLPVREVRFFDLRNLIARLRARYAQPGPYASDAMRFLVRWPLVMATSIPTAHGAADNPGFHEEYVLPQLLLEWVNNVRGQRHKITGIMYSSARVGPDEAAYQGAYNIVVPAEQTGPTGLCPVRIRQFEISTPVAVGELLPPPSADQSVAEVAQALEARLAQQDYHRLNNHNA